MNAHKKSYLALGAAMLLLSALLTACAQPAAEPEEGPPHRKHRGLRLGRIHHDLRPKRSVQLGSGHDDPDVRKPDVLQPNRE